MEYYVYRNGEANHAIVFDTRDEAVAYLGKLKASSMPKCFWYMEDEDSVAVK